MQAKAYYKYAQDVIEGNVVCGKYIKLAAERFLTLWRMTGMNSGRRKLTML